METNLRVPHLALLGLLAITPSAVLAEDPKVLPSMVEELKVLTKAAKIKKFYILVAPKTFGSCKKLIHWNLAAQEVYKGGVRDGYCKLEHAAWNEQSIGADFRSLGIEDGFSEAILYESWPTNLVVAGTGKEQGKRLIWETWIGDTVGRATTK